MKAYIASAAMILTFGGTMGVRAQQVEGSAAHRTLVVSVEDRKLALVEDGRVTRTYSVAVGKPSTPSPEGNFVIQRRIANPTYQHNGKTIPAGPNNPVGTRWMGLSKAGYGIHGTNEPNSIGKAASHGCIRMAKADLEELYKQVAVGDRVEIISHRNQETAALFTPAPAAAPAGAVLASVEAHAVAADASETHVEQPAPALIPASGSR